jgi:L-ribulose-5-phosphate 3-epimerase
MPYFAVMQGRLVPPEGGNVRYFPRRRWQEEFALASRAGLNGIEWIYDGYSEDMNPLATDEGVAQMRNQADAHGIAVHSLCANYVMDSPPLRSNAARRSEFVRKLGWLLSRCRAAGINRIVLPFLDEAAIETGAGKIEVLSILNGLLPEARRNRVEIHLELSLGPQAVAGLLGECPDPLLRIAYDCGNSASLGFDRDDEFAAYGDRIGSVHLKDRVRGGGSVPPGTGDANFLALFRSLRQLAFTGEFVLELALPEPGEELLYISKCRRWLEEQAASAQFAGDPQ